MAALRMGNDNKNDGMMVMMIMAAAVELVE